MGTDERKTLLIAGIADALKYVLADTPEHLADPTTFSDWAKSNFRVLGSKLKEMVAAVDAIYQHPPFRVFTVVHAYTFVCEAANRKLSAEERDRFLNYMLDAFHKENPAAPR